MIEYRNGDIFGFDDIEVVIHQANCFNTMRSGIAKTISELYPEAVEADCRTIKGDRSKLGTFTSTGPCSDGRIIINMYSQYEYGTGRCFTEYDAMEQALNEFIEDYETSYSVTGQPLIVGVPYKIGCDRAGGDWNKVNDMLMDLFTDRKEFLMVVCRKD